MLILLVVITGLMAGLYFAFSVFVMQALNKLSPTAAGQAMNNINDVIVNTLFLPLFFGSTLWFAGLIVWQIADWNEANSIFFVSSAVIYIVGMFGVTAFGNVPLNNQLQRSNENDNALAMAWKNYYQPWLRLNHIRTISCILSTALLLMAMT